jgi:Leucine-rich repeat (LRR) protein
VCRDWRGTVDSRLITQLCCDIDELPRLGKFLNLRHVVVEGAAVRMRGRQSMQQRLWAHARLSSKGPNRDVNQKLPRLEALPASRGNLSPLAALPGVQAVTLRCLPLLTANFLQQAAHLTHLTSLTLHNPLGERGVQMLQLPEALSALTQLKALTLIRVSDLARKALLGPAAPLGTPAAAGHSHPPPSSSKAPTGSRAQPATSVPCPWLAGLQHLAIRHSDLPDLRPALASLTSCTHLDLSHCSFKHGLPPSLGQLTQLKVGAAFGAAAMDTGHLTRAVCVFVGPPPVLTRLATHCAMGLLSGRVHLTLLQ